MQGAFFLDVLVLERAAVLQRPAGEDQNLLGGVGSPPCPGFFDLRGLDRDARLNVKRDRLTGRCRWRRVASFERTQAGAPAVRSPTPTCVPMTFGRPATISPRLALGDWPRPWAYSPTGQAPTPVRQPVSTRRSGTAALRPALDLNFRPARNTRKTNLCEELSAEAMLLVEGHEESVGYRS